jgi:hypothetical protein
MVAASSADSLMHPYRTDPDIHTADKNGGEMIIETCRYYEQQQSKGDCVCKSLAARCDKMNGVQYCKAVLCCGEGRELGGVQEQLCPAFKAR